MTLSQTFGDDLCHKLRLVGLTKGEVLPIVNLLTKQVNAEGPENVVKRLKHLKQAAVDKLAGSDSKFPWIKHSNGVPKGPWRVVWTKLESRSYRHRKRAFNALMVYASLVLPERAAPTATQERKFLGSVEHSTVEADIRNQSANAFSNDRHWKQAVRYISAVLSQQQWSGRKLSHAPDVMAYILSRKGTEQKGVDYAERTLLPFLGENWGREFHAFPEVLQTLGEYGDQYFQMVHPWHGAHRNWKEADVPTEPVGVIGSSQEPGFKFRAFASPNLVLQAALEPLKQKLLDAVRGLSFDCTFDQEKGVRGVQQWLREGNTVFAVDLSDATNNFPLVLQESMLSQLGLPESSISLLGLVSRSPYRKMWGDKSNVQWDVGQPLGAGPSFPAFALAHAALAICAGLKAGMTAEEASTRFFLLGDDFVTNHAGLHVEYRKCLKTLSCPISEQKCLESQFASEFAGKLIMKNHVYHGFKYREVSDLSFMSVIRTLGRQALSRHLLSHKQYSIAKALEDVPEPYGLGFNPKGIPLQVRWERYLQLVDKLKVEKPQPVMTYSELKNKFAYQSRSEIWSYLGADRDLELERAQDRLLKWRDGRKLAELQIVPSETVVPKTVSGSDPRKNDFSRFLEGSMKIIKAHETVTSSHEASINLFEWRKSHSDSLGGVSTSTKEPLSPVPHSTEDQKEDGLGPSRPKI